MQADPLFYDIENSCHSDTQVNNDVQESYARHSSTGSQQSSSKKPRRHSSTGSQSSSKSRRRSSAGSTADSLTPDTEVPTVNNTEPDKIIPGDMSDITDGFECFGNTITASDEEEEEEEEEANNTNNKDQGQYDFESQSDDNKSQSDDDDDDGGLSTIFSGDEESNYGQLDGTFA